MTAARKIVLVSESAYVSNHDDVLRDLINRPIHFFCAVGDDGWNYINAVDRLVSEMFFESHIAICRQPFESEAEAVALAKKMRAEDLGEDVEIIRI